MDEIKDRQEQIHDKGFNMSAAAGLNAEGRLDYSKIRVGPKTLDDAVLTLGALPKSNKMYARKDQVVMALARNDIPKLREISQWYYNMSGVYTVACNYLANLYRYDWYIVPEVYDNDVAEEKVIKNFKTTLNYLDNSHIKKMSSDIALDVIREGAYYGYIVRLNSRMMLQKLPIKYCRSRYMVGNNPAVEFDMRFFDDAFPDDNYRQRILRLFPAEFQKGYSLYRQRKLKPDFAGDVCGYWYLLDVENTVKFSFNNGDKPLLVNAIPAIIDLDAAQDLDRRKQMQQLLKIIIQKLPLDKNGDLVFDIDEATDIHNNAVEMLKRAIGVDVMTTFADVESIDMSDNATVNSTDALQRVERTVYNSLGISQNLFNTEGSVALEKSILNDESSMRPLLLQFHIFFDRITQELNSKNRKKYNFRLYMLETTQYNYKEMSKLYKEQTQIGFSKMLPQIALGHSQSAILNTAVFENEVLHLTQIMIPPLMSSTLSSEDVLGIKSQDNTSKNQNNTEGTTSAGGRPEKSDDEKSDKTLANEESQK